jgi:hypothetical protein
MTAKVERSTINYLNHLPAGWFVLDVMPTNEDEGCLGKRFTR